MIISCPGCKKQYDLTPHLVSGKKFYKMHCAACGTHWRLNAEDLGLNLEPRTRRVLKGHDPVTYSPNVASDIAPAPQLRKAPDVKTYSAWHDLVKQYSLDWVILLAAVAVAILIMFYEGQFITDFSFWPSFFHSSSPAPSPSGGASFDKMEPPQDTISPTAQKVENYPVTAPLSSGTGNVAIENIDFSTHEEHGRLRFVVKGEVLNQTHETVPCPDLNVIAWGECPLDPENPKDRDSISKGERFKKCVLSQWVYPMNNQALKPGERKFFQSPAPSNGLADVKEIEVTHSPR